MAVARLTDEQGREYQLVGTKGLAFARNQSDWTIVSPGGSVPASFTFSGPSGGARYNFSADMRQVWGANGQTRLGTFQVYFPSLRR